MDLNLAPDEKAFRDEFRAWLAANLPRDWIHGGMGFTWENDLHLYYRRAKASETAFGDAAFHRERLARLVIDTAALASTGA